MKTLSIVIKAKIAQAVVDRLLKNLAKTPYGITHPRGYKALAEEREQMEQDVMIVLDQKRWWK